MSLDSGVQGLPPDTKESGNRVDFDAPKFDLAIETKGYRIAWSRASLCPCAPVNRQTEQPDPNCTLCKSSGWIYFAPSLATVDPLKVGELDEVQLRIVNDNAAVIRSIMTGIGVEFNVYDPIGSRLEGTMNATVRAQNKLGYYDKITHLDSTIAFTQVLDAGDPANPLETRYPIVKVNVLRSFTTIFTSPKDFDVQQGKIIWNVGGSGATIPTEDTRLAIHYLCHPTWLVMEHPHSLRTTAKKSKIPKPITPAGDPIPLPIQAIVKYEFLPDLE